MRKFEDENGNIITITELQREFEEKQKNDPETYDYTFNNYILNCTDKNGTLTEITINREKMIDYIMDNLCPYEMADTETSEDDARIQLELMPITELEKIYKEYKKEKESQPIDDSIP